MLLLSKGGENMAINNDVNERIRHLRKDCLKLNQEDFAKVLGVTNTAISKLEKGERNLTEQMAKSICREFKVNYYWLTEGIGDNPFVEAPSNLIDEIAEEYSLDEMDIALLKGYLEMTDEERKAFKKLFSKVFK